MKTYYVYKGVEVVGCAFAASATEAIATVKPKADSLDEYSAEALTYYCVESATALAFDETPSCCGQSHATLNEARVCGAEQGCSILIREYASGSTAVVRPEDLDVRESGLSRFSIEKRVFEWAFEKRPAGHLSELDEVVEELRVLVRFLKEARPYAGLATVRDLARQRLAQVICDLSPENLEFVLGGSGKCRGYIFGNPEKRGNE